MDYKYQNWKKKQRIKSQRKPFPIRKIYTLFSSKVLVDLPNLYNEIIYDLTDNRTEYIVQAIENQFLRDGINLEPTSPINQEEWRKDVDNW